MSFEEKNLCVGQAAAGACSVNIAAYGVHGCDLSERFKNGLIAHVAKMKDMVNSAQSGKDFRT